MSEEDNAGLFKALAAFRQAGAGASGLCLQQVIGMSLGCSALSQCKALARAARAQRGLA